MQKDATFHGNQMWLLIKFGQFWKHYQIKSWWLSSKYLEHCNSVNRDTKKTCSTSFCNLLKFLSVILKRLEMMTLGLHKKFSYFTFFRARYHKRDLSISKKKLGSIIPLKEPPQNFGGQKVALFDLGTSPKFQIFPSIR